MKKNIPFLILLSILATQLISQENCNPFFTLTKGTTWKTETTFKNKKRKFIQLYEVVDVKDAGGIQEAYIEVFPMIGKKKPSKMLKQELIYTCLNGEMSLGWPIPKKPLKDEYKEQVKGLKIPDTLSVGMKLSDARYIVKISLNSSTGNQINHMSSLQEFEYTNRVVEKKEKITTPMGTFEAYKITSIFKVNDLYSKGKKKEGKPQVAIEYIVEGIGMVLLESNGFTATMSEFTPVK